MATVQRFEDLKCWQTARSLTGEVYRLSQLKPFASDLALSDQIRRSANSICANIAEGFYRKGDKEFRLFLSYALGSAGETRSHTHIAYDVGYLSHAQYADLVDRCRFVESQIRAFLRYLRDG